MGNHEDKEGRGGHPRKTEVLLPSEWRGQWVPGGRIRGKGGVGWGEKEDRKPLSATSAVQDQCCHVLLPCDLKQICFLTELPFLRAQK